MNNSLPQATIDEIINFHCPRFKEIPAVPLYKDQVIIYIENTLKDIHVNKDEKLLTPTMLNNYVKQKVISPPQNKKYNEKHIAYLIVVCILKQVYSLNEICELISLQISRKPIESAYDYFCQELENILISVFQTRDLSLPAYAESSTFEKEMVKSATLSFAHKIFIQNVLLEQRNKLNN